MNKNDPLIVKKAWEKAKGDPKLVREFWKKGLLSYKLRPWQIPIYVALREAEKANPDDKYVLELARRIGKTFVCSLIAVEDCFRNKNFYFDLVGPTQSEMRKAILPAMNEILVDCPEDLKPSLNQKDNFYKFGRTGSQINIFGVNNGHENDGRGGTAHKILVDEAGQIDQLDYVLHGVFIPKMNTTQGLCICASTPALTMDHNWFDIREDARLKGTYSILTHANIPDLPEEMKEHAIKTSGGVHTTNYQREYLCLWVVDEDRHIIKEWISAPDNVRVVEKDDLYKFWDKYVGMDLGFKRDLTAIIFGYYNFRKAQLVIEKEWTCKGPATITSELAKIIPDTEKALWGEQKPYRRISDNNEGRTIADLNITHGITFIETDKDQLPAMVNEVRLWVESGRLIVHPDCKQTIGCLESGIWEVTHKKFDRSTVYGHYDALAALIYLIRNINEHHNPIPRDYLFDPYTQTRVNTGHAPTTQARETVNKLIPGLRKFGR